MIEARLLTMDLTGRYMVGICEILEGLHSNNPPLIHRDIKPTNIMISEFGNVMLLDFNAAKYQSGQKGRESDTVLLGTQGYAAPEQYGFGESSPKTDIYSLGIVLKEAVQSLNAYDGSFDAIIEKCTRIDPSKRYRSVTDLKKALIGITGGERPQKPKEDQVNKWLPPGFRTLKIWKMIIALPVYALIALLTIGMEMEGYSGGSLWTSRIFLFITFMSNIFIICNYGDVQSHFAPCRSKNIIISILGVLGLMFIVTFALIALFVILEGILFQFK